VLTILSLLGSWIASRHYAELSFNTNLRVFALKAAEKVNNLSNELDRLSAFLQQELESVENYTPDQTILSKEATIEAAIHMINTLKSVNDTSLSDWRGVIGDELSAQREERKEREEDLRELVDRIELLSLQLGDTKDARDYTTALLSKEVTSIKSDLRMLASQVGGVPLRRPKMIRREVELACPSCSNALRYTQKLKEGSFKAITCQECHSKLISVYNNGSFLLTRNEPQAVRTACPVCNGDLNVMLELTPGKAVTINCSSCKADVQVVRAKNEIRTRLVPFQRVTDIQLNENILTLVQQAMPPQPWPKGAAKAAAVKLGLPHSLVSDAVTELIKRGTFDMQIDGTIYKKVSNEESASPHS
jgi:uncharacterized protein YbaR (Trm112 family)